MGGPVLFVENWQRFLPEANVIREVPAERAGHVAAIDGEALGLAVVGLGGGRAVENDRINPAVGLAQVVRLGAAVEKGTPLAVVHAARPEDAEAAARQVRDAIRLSDAPVTPPDLICERVG
jgi:thymidine phosphorylase